jgi:hypothetical protein
MEHSFLLLTSGSLEVAINVAASTRPHMDRFLGSMVQRGWAVSKIEAEGYRNFCGDRRKIRVLEDVQATYKIREASLTET